MGEEEGRGRDATPLQPRPATWRRGTDMSGHDAELAQLKAAVSCALLLERGGYSLDRKDSTKHCLKYRRGAGEVVIVNHGGQGWWDPMSDAKGDVFTLAQRLDPGLNFGQVRKHLRALVGIAPSYPEAERMREPREPSAPPTERWSGCRRLRPGTAAWAYLTVTRALPPAVLQAADLFDAVREGPHGSAWFAHRGHDGALTGMEMRGPDWRGFSAGHDKTLFRLPGGTAAPTRLAVCEAAIDALSLAALEDLRADTLYVATTGGMGPPTVACLDALLLELAGRPGAVLVAATDADAPGCRHAARLAGMAEAAGVRSERLLPPGGHNDWNDALVARKVAA